MTVRAVRPNPPNPPSLRACTPPSVITDNADWGTLSAVDLVVLLGYRQATFISNGSSLNLLAEVVSACVRELWAGMALSAPYGNQFKYHSSGNTYWM